MTYMGNGRTYVLLLLSSLLLDFVLVRFTKRNSETRTIAVLEIRTAILVGWPFGVAVPFWGQIINSTVIQSNLSPERECLFRRGRLELSLRFRGQTNYFYLKLMRDSFCSKKYQELYSSVFSCFYVGKERP